jgi:hypothetical protein
MKLFFVFLVLTLCIIIVCKKHFYEMFYSNIFLKNIDKDKIKRKIISLKNNHKDLNKTGIYNNQIHINNDVLSSELINKIKQII